MDIFIKRFRFTAFLRYILCLSCLLYTLCTPFCNQSGNMPFHITIFGSTPITVFADTEPSAILDWPEAPEIKASAGVVMEASTGTVLYEKNAYDTYYPASTTKLMTSLLAIEQCPLSDIVTCSKNSIYDIDRDSSRIGLTVGEQITMEDALYAILLASANEVSYAVAEHIGGTLENFVSLMNKRAAELGCVNTHFKNPHGLDDPDHYSCPYDLALIAKQAITYTTFRRVSGSYYHEIPPTNLNVARPIGNTHQIIRRKIKYEGVFAGKTGHTSLAGTSLVTCAERNGLTLICVVMKESVSDNAYSDTMSLLDYGFNNFHLFELSSSGTDSANSFPTLFQDEETITAKIQSPLSISETSLLLPVTASYQEVTKQFSLEQLSSFDKGSNIIGEVSYYYCDHYIGSAEILYHSPDMVSLEPTAPTTTPEDTSFPENTAELQMTPAAEVLSQPSGTEESEDLRPVIIGVSVTAVSFLLGSYLVLIELPYRKKRREYQNRKKNWE